MKLYPRDVKAAILDSVWPPTADPTGFDSKSFGPVLDRLFLGNYRSVFVQTHKTSKPQLFNFSAATGISHLWGKLIGQERECRYPGFCVVNN